jgi:beta-glucosidase
MEKFRDKSFSAQERAEDLTDRMTTEEQAEQLKYDAPKNERLGLDAYNWWSEGLHGVARAGVATMFPQAIGLAAMFDEETLYKVADIISTEARAKYNEFTKHNDRDIFKGLNLWSPNINIFRDPRWGRGQETYGEDPYLTSHLGVALQKDFKVIQMCLKPLPALSILQ